MCYTREAMALFGFIFGAFGLIIGSFLNVVVLRKGVASLEGRSKCSSCGTMLRAFDLVPVFSWLFLRGRCRYCGSRISIQYPIVEATTAILFALVGASPFPPDLLSKFFFCVIIAILICITVYDMRHTIIPDSWAYAFALLALLIMGPILTAPPNSFSVLWYVFSGPIAALPLFLLWLVSGGRWMGLGDAKLALGIGWLLGPTAGGIAIFFSFIVGTAILVPLLLFERVITHIQPYQRRLRGLTMKSEVPFGPFLIGSCLLLWFIQLYGLSIPFFEI